MDFITKEKRSKIMSSIKAKDTKPELHLRKSLFAQGFRYRVNYRKLPGKPDIVFVSRKIAIFVNGCFWHQHKNCKITNIPKSNSEFWANKFKANQDRDKKNVLAIKKIGWNVLTVWECEILDINRKVRNLSSIISKI
jgi:DNA mismatch endonuclease (patch repair protein)